MLRREWNHRRGAAKRGRHRRAVEIVGAHDPGRGFLLDMAMAVDRAGQDELAAGVDVTRAGREPLTERNDRSAAHADVALRRIGGGRDRAVADHQIVVGHPMFLVIVRSSATGQSPEERHSGHEIAFPRISAQGATACRPSNTLSPALASKKAPPTKTYPHPPQGAPGPSLSRDAKAAPVPVYSQKMTRNRRVILE